MGSKKLKKMTEKKPNWENSHAAGFEPCPDPPSLHAITDSTGTADRFDVLSYPT